MLNLIGKILKVLNSEIDPSQIAGGFILGMIMGLTPLMSLHNVLVLFCICIFRVNISSALIAMGLFSMIAYLADPLFVQVGEALLLNPDLKDLWTGLYQQDIWKLSHFNNTLTMGSLVVSLILLIPMFFISRFLVVKYRDRVLAWVRKTRIVQGLKATKWFQAVTKVSDAVEGKL